VRDAHQACKKYEWIESFGGNILEAQKRKFYQGVAKCEVAKWQSAEGRDAGKVLR